MTFPSAVVTNTQSLAIDVQRLSIPILGMDPDVVPFGPSVRNFAATRTIDPITITFTEDVSFNVMTSFLAWTKLVIDANGNFSVASVYWQPISFQPILLDGTGPNTYTYNSCWPTHITGLDWDGSVMNHVTPTVTFAVDPMNNLNGYPITG